MRDQKFVSMSLAPSVFSLSIHQRALPLSLLHLPNLCLHLPAHSAGQQPCAPNPLIVVHSTHFPSLAHCQVTVNLPYLGTDFLVLPTLESCSQKSSLQPGSAPPRSSPIPRKMANYQGKILNTRGFVSFLRVISLYGNWTVGRNDNYRIWCSLCSYHPLVVACLTLWTELLRVCISHPGFLAQ